MVVLALWIVFLALHCTVGTQALNICVVPEQFCYMQQCFVCSLLLSVWDYGCSNSRVMCAPLENPRTCAFLEFHAASACLPVRFCAFWCPPGMLLLLAICMMLAYCPAVLRVKRALLERRFFLLFGQPCQFLRIVTPPSIEP